MKYSSPLYDCMPNHQSRFSLIAWTYRLALIIQPIYEPSFRSPGRLSESSYSSPGGHITAKEPTKIPQYNQASRRQSASAIV
jgi:hypothetical protein